MFIVFKTFAQLVLFLCLSFGILTHSAHGATIKPDSHVLILNSYHPQYLWTKQLVDGAIAELTQVVSPENIHIEYMDSRRFSDDEVHLKRLFNLYQYAYQKFKPDVILTSDDAALNFIVEFGDQLFTDIPVVFAGVNVLDRQKLVNKPNITGIMEGMELEGNLNLIHQLQPNVKQILILGDNSGLGLQMANEASIFRQQWLSNEKTKHIELEVLTDFSLTALKQRAQGFGHETAMLVLAIHRDNTGHYFSYEYDLPKLTFNTPVPVYGMWGGGLIINNGAVGGMLNDPLEHGASAAKLAVKILNGTPVENLPIKPKSVFKPKFNYQALQRFGIEQSRLPPESIVAYQPISFYQKHTTVINVAILVFGLLLVIIVLLVLHLKQKNANQTQLKRFNRDLAIQVKERTVELERQKADIEHLANHDVLTGLPTQRLFFDRLDMAIKTTERNQDKMALLLLDLDGFKRVNDNFGHDAGDVVLKEVSNQIQHVLRQADTVSRIGGDEFLVILPSLHSVDEAQQCCQRLIDAINLPNIYMGNKLKVGVSIGVAIYPDDACNAVDLRKIADKLMYEVKKSGKNNFKAVEAA